MTAIARSHLENGARYYSIGRYVEAAREFRAAYDLSHRAEVLFNLARALEDGGQDADALDASERFEAAGAPGVEPTTIRTRIAVVRARVSAARATDTRTSATTNATATSAPPHAATTPDTTHTTTSASASNASTPVAIAPVRRAPAPTPRRDYTVPVVLFSAGGAMLVTGLALGLTARSTWRELEAACPGHVCDPSREADARSAATRGTVGDVLGGVGLATIAAGVVVIAVTGAREEAPRVGVACTSEGCAGRVSVAF